MRNNLSNYAPWVLATLVIILVAASGNVYLATVGILVVINAIAAAGLSLFVSYAGQFSLGHGALMGIGAYGSAIAAKSWSVDPLLSIVIGAIMAAVIGLLIGLPTVRLAGYYLAIATYGFGVILYVVFQEGGEVTGGSQGMSGIPPLKIFGINLSSDPLSFFVLAAVILLACMACIYAIVNSNYGRGLRTLSTSEPAAAAMGVAVSRTKLEIFVLSAAMAGLAGGLYTYSIRYLDPTAFSPAVSIWLLIIIALGGARSLWGPVLGSLIFVGLREVLKSVLPAVVPQSGSRAEILVFGVLLILVLLFPPNKLWASLTIRTRELLASRSRTAGNPEIEREIS